MDERQTKVIIALENSNYDWRTINGISKETGFSGEEVVEILKQLEEQIIRSSIPDKDGDILYTTRNHYYNTRSILTRSLTAASGSVKS